MYILLLLLVCGGTIYIYRNYKRKHVNWKTMTKTARTQTKLESYGKQQEKNHYRIGSFPWWTLCITLGGELGGWADKTFVEIPRDMLCSCVLRCCIIH